MTEQELEELNSLITTYKVKLYRYGVSGNVAKTLCPGTEVLYGDILGHSPVRLTKVIEVDNKGVLKTEAVNFSTNTRYAYSTRKVLFDFYGTPKKEFAGLYLPKDLKVGLEQTKVELEANHNQMINKVTNLDPFVHQELIKEILHLL